MVFVGDLHVLNLLREVSYDSNFVLVKVEGWYRVLRVPYLPLPKGVDNGLLQQAVKHVLLLDSDTDGESDMLLSIQDSPRVEVSILNMLEVPSQPLSNP